MVVVAAVVVVIARMITSLKLVRVAAYYKSTKLFQQASAL